MVTIYFQAATSFHASKKRNYSRRVDAADSDTTRVNTRQVEFDTFITSFIDDFNKSKMKRNKKRISKNSISSKNVRKHRINTSFEFGANSESETEISPLKVKILENILIQPAEHEINRENELKEIEKENSEQ